MPPAAAFARGPHCGDGAVLELHDSQLGRSRENGRRGVSASEHFNLDIDLSWSFNLKVEPYKRDELVAEDEDTCTYLDGNGATLRRYKTHDSTPEHIGYRVSDRAGWEEFAKPFLTPSPDRIDFEGYRRTAGSARSRGDSSAGPASTSSNRSTRFAGTKIT